MDISFKKTQGERLKILTPKEMLQRLSIALKQEEAVNTSENFLNEVRQIINSLYQAKEIAKRISTNMMKSMKV